jgi:hypothetical protein
MLMVRELYALTESLGELYQAKVARIFAPNNFLPFKQRIALLGNKMEVCDVEILSRDFATCRHTLILLYIVILQHIPMSGGNISELFADALLWLWNNDGSVQPNTILLVSANPRCAPFIRSVVMKK